MIRNSDSREAVSRTGPDRATPSSGRGVRSGGSADTHSLLPRERRPLSSRTALPLPSTLRGISGGRGTRCYRREAHIPLLYLLSSSPYIIFAALATIRSREREKAPCVAGYDESIGPGVACVIGCRRLVIIAASIVTKHIHAACHINFLFLFFLILFSLSLLSSRTVAAGCSTTTTTTASAACNTGRK